MSKNIPDNSIVIGNPARIVSSTSEFKKKHEENSKKKPVFNTYWKKKTKEQKQEGILLLKDTYGYDEWYKNLTNKKADTIEEYF